MLWKIKIVKAETEFLGNIYLNFFVNDKHLKIWFEGKLDSIKTLVIKYLDNQWELSGIDDNYIRLYELADTTLSARMSFKSEAYFIKEDTYGYALLA